DCRDFHSRAIPYRWNTQKDAPAHAMGRIRIDALEDCLPCPLLPRMEGIGELLESYLVVSEFTRAGTNVRGCRWRRWSSSSFQLPLHVTNDGRLLDPLWGNLANGLRRLVLLLFDLLEHLFLGGLDGFMFGVEAGGI